MQVGKKTNDKYTESFIELETTQKIVIMLFKQVLVIVRGAPTSGSSQAEPAFERNDTLLVSPTLGTLTKGKTIVQVTNPDNHTYSLESCVAVANSKVTTPQQAANTKPITHVDDTSVSQLFHERTENDLRQWHTTPETCDDPSKLKKVERRIYNEIITLRSKEQFNPTTTDGHRQEFFWKFNWDKSLLKGDKKTRLEHSLAEYRSIFESFRHRYKHRVQS